MKQLQLGTSDTWEIARRLAVALRAGRRESLKKGATKEQIDRTEINFIKEILDIFRQQIIFRPPPIN